MTTLSVNAHTEEKTKGGGVGRREEGEEEEEEEEVEKGGGGGGGGGEGGEGGVGRGEGGRGGGGGEMGKEIQCRSSLCSLPPHLVVRHELLLLLRHHSALLSGTGDDALQSVGDLLLRDLRQRAARGEDGGLVQEVLQGSAGEAGGAAGNLEEGSL
jgi:hypothetical protein